MRVPMTRQQYLRPLKEGIALLLAGLFLALKSLLPILLEQHSILK
jgi:hypothetical protein